MSSEPIELVSYFNNLYIPISVVDDAIANGKHLMQFDSDYEREQIENIVSDLETKGESDIEDTNFTSVAEYVMDLKQYNELDAITFEVAISPASKKLCLYLFRRRVESSHIYISKSTDKLRAYRFLGKSHFKANIFGDSEAVTDLINKYSLTDDIPSLQLIPNHGKPGENITLVASTCKELVHLKFGTKYTVGRKIDGPLSIKVPDLSYEKKTTIKIEICVGTQRDNVYGTVLAFTYVPY